jgi:hypothetical protein
MLTKDLQSIVLLNALTSFGTLGKKFNLLAAGPLVKQPSTKPYRIVLVDFEDEFTVHTEILRDDNPDLSKPVDCESFFEQGDYFSPNQLGEAYLRFAERVAHHAQFTNSAYRLLNKDT